MKHLRSNVCLAVSVGSLRTIAEELPGGRQKGGCIRLADSIFRQAHKLPKIHETDIDMLSRCIDASAGVLEEFGDKKIHAMLNLAAFCMEENKEIFTENTFYNLRKLFTFFHGSDCYEDIRLGDRLFTRLTTEVEIEIAQTESAA